MKTNIHLYLFIFTFLFSVKAFSGSSLQVSVAGGLIEGLDDSGLRVFKGIPYAAPPVGDLRWKEPQPMKSWTGVRETKLFGPRAMQLPVFGDMNFRSNGMSEDCLYLNVWTPARSSSEKLPVLVYYYGGGFIAGDGSECRYDGESLARRGIVVVTINYRLGVFGFMSHPELTQESSHHASGNYGLLDQAAALQWVKNNITAFGGDPARITIGGESAGSISVSVQMVSPLTRNLIAGAIGESGSIMGMSLSPVSLADGEKEGLKFQSFAGAHSLADLRKMPAEDLLKLNYPRFPLVVDGYLITEKPETVFQKGEQAQIPLLIGWNSQEMVPPFLMGNLPLTVDNYKKTVQRVYGSNADAVLKAYPAATDADVEKVCTALASDNFIAFSTWKWSDMHVSTGIKSIYRYFYARPRPAMRPEMGNAVAGLAGGVTKEANAPRQPAATGAAHSAEIEYALGNLPTNRVYDWQPEDYKVSTIMEAYFANFIKTGNPNGTALPHWSPVVKNTDAAVMNIDVNTYLQKEEHRNRYLLLNSF
ncbi:MAG: carboxylesterase family protein [Dysgonamonadaceae bacterium]